VDTIARYTNEWKDAGGVAHAPFRAPRRIVSLVPSLTETVHRVGARAQLAGITAFCIWPGDLLKDPAIAKVGGTKKFSREKVLALQPDLVLVNLEENELEDIEFLKARVECYINGVRTVAEGLETLREIGALTGCLTEGDRLASEGEVLLGEIRRRTSARVKAGSPPRRVFYPIWRDPWMTVTRDTFIANHLRELGAITVPEFGAEAGTRYPQVTLEQVGAAHPEVVWLPSEPFHFKEPDATEIRAHSTLGRARVELVDGDPVCWFGGLQLEGLPYAYKKLWGEELTLGKGGGSAPAGS